MIPVKITVQLKWLLEPKGILDVKVGRPLRVPCTANGQPPPKIDWIKLDDESRTTGRRTFGGSLEFNAIGQDDGGFYECRASNGVEKDLMSRIKLNVLGK